VHERLVRSILACDGHLVAKKVKEVAKVLEDHGWMLVRQRGSHRTYKRPCHPSLVTISGRWNSTMTVGMLTSVRRTSGIEELR
jgi:predicted RNA binding protein YcfA (HicA-like mRNA interferase family)